MIKKIGIIHNGCAKNLVDTELMVGRLIEAGFETTLDVDDSSIDAYLINTCSFIQDAEKESVQSILNIAQKGKKIVVAGCLAQKYKKELVDLMPEISSLVGVSNIDDVVGAFLDDKVYVKENPRYVYPEDVDRAHITIGASAYIKIAEGCNYSCGYCVIPKLRGKYSSRRIGDVVAEAKKLANLGVNEIILIAQDTTSYGIDLYGKPALARLLEELNKIDNISWIRVLYTYPTNFDDILIEAFQKLDKVVKYIDIPLQHSHPEMLKKMLRPNIDTEKLINKLRKAIPNVCIRTTFIVGYPTETEEEFQHLKKFIQKMKFDRVGVFTYSREKGTYSNTLKPQISAKVKNRRKKELMLVQQEISREINEKLIGKTIPCIIEQITPKGAIARSHRDSPDVDGVVYIKTDKILSPLDIEDVKIIASKEYDLWGEV